jgi:hypothetical protein
MRGKIFQLGQAVFHRENRLRIVQMHLRFEGDAGDHGRAHIRYAKRGMRRHEMAAATRAELPVAHPALVEMTEQFIPLRDPHISTLPEKKRAGRIARIAAAGSAMAVAHLQWRAADLDLHRAAKAVPLVRISHFRPLSARPWQLAYFDRAAPSKWGLPAKSAFACSMLSAFTRIYPVRCSVTDGAAPRFRTQNAVADRAIAFE